MPNPNLASHFLDGANNFVPDMQYHSEVGNDGITRQYWPLAPVAAGATAVVNAQSIATVITNIPMASIANRETLFGPWGRAVVVVLSVAGTPTITIKGRDYLGQPMTETIVAAGTSPVAGKKAFKYVDIVNSSAVVAGTLSVGVVDVFGLQFCSEALLQENVDDRVTGNAGTFVAAVATDPQTATTGDPRGTYAPNAANAANGVRKYRLVVHCNKNKLHGVKHFGG